MPLYLFTYFFCIVAILFLTMKVFLRYKNYVHGVYFLVSGVTIALWLFLYLLSFTTTYDIHMLLLLSRSMFGLAIVSMYSMLSFVWLFSYKKEGMVRGWKHMMTILVLFLGFFLASVTPYVIEGMLYDTEKQIYYESYGPLYSLYSLLYLAFIPIFVVVSYLKIKRLSSINKIRLSYFSIGFLLFMGLEIIFLSILPLFGIRLFEREHILFFIPFLLAIWYALHRYYTTSLKTGVGQIIVGVLALGVSISVSNILLHYFLQIDTRLIHFWGISKDTHIFNTTISILVFIPVYGVFGKYMLGKYRRYQDTLNEIKQKIPFLTTLYDLEQFLQKSLSTIFKISYVHIQTEKVQDTELGKYFSKDTSRKIFIYDTVFIEENKHKFNKKQLLAECDEKIYIVFPIRNKLGELEALLFLGAKPFRDVYTEEEVEALNDFVVFLEGHLKYIDIYRQINDFNVNLDKKIDEKTMQYNDLINKQKEFIAYVSHEVKSPLAAAIFQLDCILDDIETDEIEWGKLKTELSSLNTQLIKSGDLVSRLFSVQKYDYKKVKLYKETVCISELIKNEVSIFQKTFPGIDFVCTIEENHSLFFSLDTVQFLQVIDNLLNNAVKFSQRGESPQICIRVEQTDLTYTIVIEDNGQGFGDIGVSSIFDKYSTGESSSIGLGMGLYLCKEIIGLHGGQIIAEDSEKLGGARFIISLPISSGTS